MTAEQRAGLSDAALAMTQPCIDELIKDISRRVQKAGAITDTAEYQLYRAQALGESKKAIEQAVSKQIGISEEVIASLFEYVADKSLSLDENGSLRICCLACTSATTRRKEDLLWLLSDTSRPPPSRPPRSTRSLCRTMLRLPRRRWNCRSPK